ncbi:MAG: type II/IV secretion system protein [Sedimentisphaerales bacterium]|nr:type II/IV secretion system protein [Sedimentisphaerales bacterium]
MNERDPVIAVLSDENVLDPAVLESVLERHRDTGDSVVSILKRDNLLSEDEFTRIVARANGIDFVDLSAEKIDPMVAHLVAHDLASRANIIPMKHHEGSLLVAMGAPLDLATRDEIELKTGYRVVPVAAAPTAIEQAIQYHFDEANVTKQVIASMRLKEDAGAGAGESDKHIRTLTAGDDPISKLVASIIKGAIAARASDIHIEPQWPDVRVRYRVDGTLRDTVRIPGSVQQEVVSHIKIMADMDISERRIPQDGHMTFEYDNREYDLRVSSLPSVGGEKMVLRILDKTVQRWALDKVVISPEDNERFRELVANPYGMILLTGPTGSGKTTTLYSVLQLINTPERNIVTVEDPVEYCLKGITQVQVKPVAGMTFPSALRSILRQDPDVILIGEIRDHETAEIAIGAALTGHLVLSTLHTNDAAAAISRLANLGVSPFLLGSALLGTVAQRLVRTCCPKCRQANEATEVEQILLFGEGKHRSDLQLWRGTGCSYCFQTGYVGRKSVYEILHVSQQITRMIVDGADDVTIKTQAVSEGMRTLRQAAVDMVLAGWTTVEEIMRVVDMDRG